MAHHLPATPADLTVVVPTLGRPTLGPCLQALAAGTVQPGRVVVVDQGPREEAASAIAAAEAAGLHVVRVHAPCRGAGAARNVGLRHAASRLVAAVDDDCCVAPEWTERVLEALEEHPRKVLTGRVEGEGGLALPSTITHVAPQVHTHPLPGRDPLFAGNMAAAADVWERVGPFDEHPVLRPAAEDNEWGYRALRAGVAIVYDPSLVVRHLDWRSDEQLAATVRRYARGQGGFYGLYLRRRDRFIARRVIHDLTRGPWWITRGVLTGNPELRARGRAQTVDLLAGVLAGLRAGASR